MRVWTLALGVMGLFVLGRALVTRSASVDGGSLMRDDEPVIVIVIVIFTGFMFYKTVGPSVLHPLQP